MGELVIKELKKFEQDPTHGHNVAFMIAQFHLQHVSGTARKNLFNFKLFPSDSQASKAVAVAYVMARVHEYPDRPMLRKLLADLLLETCKEEGRLMISACRMAQSSLILRYISKKGISSRDAARTLAVASLAMESVDRNEAKILAQKAVHIDPRCWNVLKTC